MKQSPTATPLADRLRPTKLEEIVGQEHILGKNQFLRLIIERRQPTSMILWGPPGSGKTTVARLIASSTDYKFIEISAVTAGLAQVRQIITQAETDKAAQKGTVLFVDEIHRFSKSQQDAFLPHVEAGTIVLIGATTENPSFEVIGPLLSRTRVVVLEPLTKTQLKTILCRAIKLEKISTISDEALEFLADLSGGDARMALNGLETANTIKKGTITIDTVKIAMQQLALHYDKTGEYHYNLISAFIKSMRGGDIHATLFYLARMLSSGEDPKFIARRLVVFASEDVGLAGPGLLSLATATFLAVERVGMPECQYSLFECAIACARSKKSRSVAKSMTAAFEAVNKYPDAVVPLHLRNAPTKLMKNLGYGKDTRWEPGFVHPKGFMPEGLEKLQIYIKDTD